jgi:hypothetical protein
MGLEHRFVTLGLRRAFRNVKRIVANLAQNVLESVRLP